MTKKTKQQIARDHADHFFSLIVRSRGRCQSCGERNYATLQCAHIVSRTYSATRTDEANALALCASCHRVFTSHPVLFGQFCVDKLGQEAMDVLHEKARPGTKVDWEAEAARLKALWLHIEREAS